MMKMLVITGMAMLTACAGTRGADGTSERNPGPCHAEPAQSLIGETVNGELGQRAMRLSDARLFRWIPPDSAVTLDYRPDRLNVEYDRDNRVTAIRCG